MPWPPIDVRGHVTSILSSPPGSPVQAEVGKSVERQFYSASFVLDDGMFLCDETTSLGCQREHVIRLRSIQHASHESRVL